MKLRQSMTMFAVAIVAALTFTSCNNNSTDTVATTDTQVAINNIMSRKSVRSFVPYTISNDTMTALLKAAMSAPTGRNVQPWSFVVLTDTSRYDKIFSGNHNIEIFKSAAAVVVLCADTTFVPRKHGTEEATEVKPNALWRDDMGACTENLLLAVEAYGLGAVWTSCYPYSDRMQPIREALELPGNVVPYSVVPIGKPAHDEAPKDKWKSERVHYNKW